MGKPQKPEESRRQIDAELLAIYRRLSDPARCRAMISTFLDKWTHSDINRAGIVPLGFRDSCKRVLVDMRGFYRRGFGDPKSDDFAELQRVIKGLILVERDGIPLNRVENALQGYFPLLGIDPTSGVETCVVPLKLVAPNIVGHEGMEEPVQRIPWRLLQFMCERQSAEMSDLSEVWGDHPTGPQLKSAVYRANEALIKLRFPYTLRTKCGQIFWSCIE